MTNVETLRAAVETAGSSCQRHAGSDSFWTCLTCYKVISINSLLYSALLPYGEGGQHIIFLYFY